MSEFNGTLKIISHNVVEELIKRRNLSQTDAIKTFYISKVYSLLEKEESKMWHFSPIALCDMLENELDGEKLEIPVEL